MTTAPRASGYRNYTADGTYWTVRKQGRTYWVVRIDPSKGGYEPVQWWGGYERAGAAGGAAAQLAYQQAIADAKGALRDRLHEALDSIGLGAPPVPVPPVPPKQAPTQFEGDEDE